MTGIEDRDRQLELRRRSRERRIERVKGQDGRGFFASPQAALVSMLVALGAILAFWGGAPSWVLLALGFGALAFVVGGVLLWRARRRAPPEP